MHGFGSRSRAGSSCAGAAAIPKQIDVKSAAVARAPGVNWGDEACIERSCWRVPLVAFEMRSPHGWGLFHKHTADRSLPEVRAVRRSSAHRFILHKSLRAQAFHALIEVFSWQKKTANGLMEVFS